MKLLISIDGACRRNGKPDCVSAGGVFVMHINDTHWTTHTISCSEKESTNQRGELIALIEALKYILEYQENTDDLDVVLVTDSEYLFNSLDKKWYERWAINGWKTASGGGVKNADLWKNVAELIQDCAAIPGIEIHPYHIKGHLIPFGKVTATNLLITNPSGRSLYLEARKKYSLVEESKLKELEYAQELSSKNNGFKLPHYLLKTFVTSNIVADAIATKRVEEEVAREI